MNATSTSKLDLSTLNVTILKRGHAMKKQSRLHNYVAVTLVLTPTSLMYFHEGAHPKPACTIPLSAVISAAIVSEPSISIYHGISQDCSFLVSIGDRVFKFRVDAASTATTWSEMIMAAKDEQILESGRNNPLVITNTAGDNTDGTKFWRTKPVGYIENFNAALDTISSFPAVVAGSKAMKDREGSGLSRKQIEALLTFETLICLNDGIALRVANAFFDCCAARSRAPAHERVVNEDNNNICRLLGHSIAHWLVHVESPSVLGEKIPSDKTATTSATNSIRSSLSTNIDDSPSTPQSAPSSAAVTPPAVTPRSPRGPLQPHAPCKTLILQHWIESCVLHEFHKFSSRTVTDFGTLRHNKMPFRSRSINGLFLSSLVRSVATKSFLLLKWLHPALLMVANTPAPFTVINQDSDNPSLQLPIQKLPQGGRLRSDSEDSDLGDFFKDVVACHKNRGHSFSDDIIDDIVDDTQDESLDFGANTDEDGTEGDEKDENDVIKSTRKIKPEGNYYSEHTPSLINMRSHVFVRDETETDDPLFRLVAEKRIARLARCQSERMAVTPDDPKTLDLGRLNRASVDDSLISVRPNRRGSVLWDDGGKELDDFLTGLTHMEGRKYSCDDMPLELQTIRRTGIIGDILSVRSKATNTRAARSMSTMSAISNISGQGPVSYNLSHNPIEQEVEMERMICTLIIDRMTRHKDDIPKALEILFKSIRDICLTRSESGVDSKATGQNVYYSCCSALLVTQLVSPALLAPVKWNLALPSFLVKKDTPRSSRSSSEKDCGTSEEGNQSLSPSRGISKQSSASQAVDGDNKSMYGGLSKQSSITVIDGDKSTFGGISPLYMENEFPDLGYHYSENRRSFDTTTDLGRRGSDIRDYRDHRDHRDSRETCYNISEAIRMANESKISMASRFKSLLTGSSDSPLSGRHLSIRSQSLGNLDLRTTMRKEGSDDRVNIGRKDSQDSNGDKGVEKEKDKSSASSHTPKKIPLSETLLHAAISLIVVAHMLGGEGKNLDALLFVWGGKKDQGKEIFLAARTLIKAVPLTKAFELSASLRKASKVTAFDTQNMCGSSRSGFTSAGESRALHCISKAICRVADQSCLPGPDKNKPGSPGVGGDKNQSLIQPLCMFFEDLGGGDVLHSDD